MRVLLDENVPFPATAVLRQTLRAHQVFHVEDLGWKGKKDRFLLADASNEGFHAIVTRDLDQLSDPAEITAIKKSGLHHVRFVQGSGGLADYARAVGSVVAAMYDVMLDLAEADGQRLVKIAKLDKKRRYEVINPKTHPPVYWSSPRR